MGAPHVRDELAAAASRPAAEEEPGRRARPFFAVALAFFVAGGLGFVWSAPALAAGAFTDPRLAATAHLFTLGWITTSLIGAFYALLPGMLDAPIRWVGLGKAGLWIWAPAVAAFVTGLALGAPGLHVPAAGAVGLPLFLFVASLGMTLARAPRRGLPGWCAAGALLSLVGSLLLGVVLSVNLGTGILGGTRLLVMAVHLHLGAGGWALLALIGLSAVLLPAALSSRPGTEAPGILAAALTAAGAALLLVSGHLISGAIVLPPAAVLMAAGAAAFLLQTLLYHRRRDPARTRRPGMDLVTAALALLALAVVAGLAALLGDAFRPRVLTAYGVLLVPGGLSLLIAGGYYAAAAPAAAPAGASPPAGPPGASPPAARFHPGVRGAACLLLAGGTVLAAGGALAGAEGLCRAGGLAFAAGAALLAGQMRPDRKRSSARHDL